jgi:cell division protein FtsZ
MMGTGMAEGEDRARRAAEEAIACPLLEGVDLSGAKGILVLITAAKGSLKLSESRLAMNTIRAYAAPDAHVIYGTAADDELNGNIRVTVVATGLQRKGGTQGRPQLQVLRTGTDNVPILDTPIAGVGAMGVSTGGIHAFAPSTPSVSSTYAGYAPSIVPEANTGITGNAYGASDIPAIYRNRTQAADKVSALSSGGMDDLEIPAFLRKQAD